MTQTIEQLAARVRELEEENARLSDGAVCGDCDGSGWLENRVEGRYPCACMTEAEPYQLLAEQLAAAQAYAEQLREALVVLNGVSDIGCSLVYEALALPSDTSALDAYVAEKVKEASTQLLEKLEQLTQQRDLAVEAIRHCIAAMGSVTDVKKAMDWPQLHNAQMLSLQALDAIKESEAK